MARDLDPHLQELPRELSGPSLGVLPATAFFTTLWFAVSLLCSNPVWHWLSYILLDLPSPSFHLLAQSCSRTFYSLFLLELSSHSCPHCQTTETINPNI